VSEEILKSVINHPLLAPTRVKSCSLHWRRFYESDFAVNFVEYVATDLALKPLFDVDSSKITTRLTLGRVARDFYIPTYQNAEKYTKLPQTIQNIPNSRMIDPMAIKDTNIFYCKTLQNLPKLGSLV
jgi:hypothetical protein